MHQSKSYILALPAELRLQIFEYLYDSGYRCDIWISASRVAVARYTCKDDDAAVQPPLSLPLVCRTFAAESIPLLYKVTDFHAQLTSIGSSGARTPPCSLPLKRLTIKVLRVSTSSNDIGNLWDDVSALIAWLPPNRSLKVCCIAIRIYDRTPRTGNSVCDNLKRLRRVVKPGAEVKWLLDMPILMPTSQVSQDLLNALGATDGELYGTGAWASVDGDR
jgi:hypothetical protein